MMRAHAGLLMAGCVLLLAGCVSPEEQRAMDQQKCAGYGFTPDTVAFANCMMSTSQQRDAQQAADQRAFQARMAADAQARAAAAAASAAAATSQPADPLPPRNAKCNSTSVTNGDTTTTHEECHW
jgi:Flp pilus assembly protein TadD